MPHIEETLKKIKGPKKVLHINNSAFILPDDFSGNIQDAMKLFLEYHNITHEENKTEFPVDPSGLFTPIGILAIGGDELKCCVDARIYELTDEGTYIDITPSLEP